MRKKVIVYILCFALAIVSMGSLIGCKEQTPIVCYFDIYNPETGERVNYDDTFTLFLTYDDVYLTYDGQPKNLDVTLRRKDNDKELNILEDIVFRYEKVSVMGCEGEVAQMVQPGTYACHIKSGSFKKEKYAKKYNVPLMVRVWVHIV